MNDHELWPWPWNSLFKPSPEIIKSEPGPISFPDAARPKHFELSGQTGTGKSRFLEGLVVLDVTRRITGLSTRGC